MQYAILNYIFGFKYVHAKVLGNAACGQICLFRWKLNAMILKALGVTDYLIGLETAWHAILIDATASIGQATFTNVLSGAGSIDVTAAINEQVFSLTDISCKTLMQIMISIGYRLHPMCYHCMVVSNRFITHQVRL